MSEPANDNPKTPKRSRRKPAMEPLGWDEIVSQPGMGGYLSFLNGPIPLPHLQGAATAPVPDPGVVLNPGPGTDPVSLPASAPHPLSEANPDPVVVSVPPSDIIPELTSIPEPKATRGPRPDLIPDPVIIPGVLSTPPSVTTAGPETRHHGQPTVHQDTVIAPTPEVVSFPAVAPGQRLRIRKCAATHDGHSLGEEVLYQALWKAATADSAGTRTIVIGWRGMSQLCRMTPKNCKINTQRLIRKLALEVLSPYNTPESIGTTYRVYSDQAILQRRREAGLEWVVRSRGVEFVDPASGTSILPICAATH